MVNNQNEFNNKYNNKKEEEIKFKDDEFEENQLIVEDYPNLKKLFLQDVDSISEITLKNLTQLQECTIWDCGTNSLVIEDCPQIKKMNVRSNLLTSLEFMKELENLEELELDGNAKLTEILKPYEGSWKVYKKNIQKLVKWAKENPQKLLEIQEENKELKVKYDILKKALASFSKEIQEQIKEKEINEIKSRMKQITTMDTKDLISLTHTNVEKLKEWKEEKQKEIDGLKEEKQETEVKLVMEKKEQLEKLKNEFMEKRVSFLDKKDEVQNSLNDYLDSIEDQMLNPNSRSAPKLKGREEKCLLKGKSDLAELLNKLAKKQQEISLLENQSQYDVKLITAAENTQILIKEESSKSEKTLAYRNKESETQVGIQVPKLGFNIGVTRKDKITTLDEYARSQQETKLGQKLINKELQLQEIEEQNQQAQTEQSPK